MNSIAHNISSNINTGDLYGSSVLNQNIYNINSDDDILETPQKFGIPINILEIIGRNDELEELYEKVVENRKRIIITGVSGIGKTFLSLHCAKEWSSTKRVKHILFFNCETDNIFKNSIDVIAKILKVKTSDEIGLLETFKQICTKLNQDDCLFIYDNIDSYDIIRSYLPPVEIRNFFVIATSQIKKWGNLLTCYPLEMMKPEVAKGFIIHKLISDDYKKEITDFSITDLLRTFDGYPLGLTHAMSFINNELDNDFNKRTVNEIVENYIIEIKNNMRENPPESSDDLYRRSVAAAILINFKKIREDKYFEKNPRVKIAIDKITQYVAFGNPNRIVPKSFDILSSKMNIEKNEIEQTLGIFVKYSITELLKYKQSFKGNVEEYTVLNIHRTVQCILRGTYQNKQFIGIICGLIQCFELDSYYSQIDFWCSHADKNVVFECAQDDWKQNCKLLVSTPKTVELIEVLLIVLMEENEKDKCQEYLQIFCEILITYGNVYVFKNCSDQVNPANEFFMKTFKQTLESHNSSTSLWDQQIRELESKLKCLGYFFGNFNHTYDSWADIHWFAWWNWIDKLKEFETDQLLSRGWKNWTVMHVGALKGHTEILKLIPEEKLRGFNDGGIGQTTAPITRKINIIEIASYFKHSEYLKILLENGWNVNIDSAYLDYINDVKIAKLLDTHEANINKIDLLSRCIHTGNIEIMKILLKPRMDLKSLNKFEQTVLRFLIKLNVLNKNQVSPDFHLDDEESGLDEKTILHWAAKNGTIQVVEILLKCKVDINQKDNFGNTALHLAASYSKLDMVRLLLNSNAEINIQNKNGETPLHIAGQQTNQEIIETLLEYKADINILNNNKQNTLIRAVKIGNLEIVRLLLEKGSDIKIIDSCDYNVLQYAVLQGNIHIVKLLLDSGADVNVCYNKTENPLCLAVMIYNIDMVKLLFEYKADVNLQAKFGDTALHWAGTCCSKDTAKLLIEYGAKPNIANKSGETPLHSITKQKFLKSNDKLYLAKFIQLLLDNGADADAVDNEGKKPIDLADRLEIIEVSKLLRRYTTEKRISYFDKDLFNENHFSINILKIIIIPLLVIIIAIYTVYI